MILSLPQIAAIIKDNPNKALVIQGVNYSKKLRRHIYGDGMAEYLTTIDGFEKNAMRDLRVKYSKSNKDLFSRLSRPIDKVFSARGGSVYLNLSEAQEKKARQLSQNVRNGYSVRKWVEMFWKPHMLDDPFGIVFMEILPMTEALAAMQQNRSFVYPTYKSITSVFDYQPKGNKLEYIVFDVTKAEKRSAGIDDTKIIYRVIDDQFDYYVERTGNDSVVILEGHTFPNFFGEVPGMINSDLVDPKTENAFLSLYDEVIELADQFLLKGSIRVTHDFLHGFPKYAEYSDICNNCNGSKYVDGKQCETCKGSGRSAMTRVSDIKLLEWPSKDEPMIKPNEVGGYISPDKTYFEIATADQQALEDAMNVTLWGTQSRLQTKGMSIGPAGDTKTATEIMDDTQPQADRLHIVSEMAEVRHKFILDCTVRLNISYSYQGSSVSYGRRYLMEGPDVIWEKYSNARTKGAPQNVLDELLTEYYDAKYQSDPVGLAMAKKLMYVEPFVHYTAQNLMALNPDPLDYKAKLYFSEWLATQNDAMLLISTVEELKASLATYASVKQLPAPEKQLPAA